MGAATAFRAMTQRRWKSDAKVSDGRAEAAADSATRYRTDLQGLRAVAVLLVMLDHAGIKAFAGGYVGVDVFFVLSGFLITSLLLGSALKHRRISLLEFYGRRARLRDYVRLVLGTVPYQLILSFAAVRAVLREARGARGWEKTAHVGAHRAAEPGEVQPAFATGDDA